MKHSREVVIEVWYSKLWNLALTQFFCVGFESWIMLWRYNLEGNADALDLPLARRGWMSNSDTVEQAGVFLRSNLEADTATPTVSYKAEPGVLLTQFFGKVEDLW